MFTPKNFQDYYRELEQKKDNQFDEYFQDILVNGMKTNPRQEKLSKDELKLFLKEHQFKLSEQDINSIINIINKSIGRALATIWTTA